MVEHADRVVYRLAIAVLTSLLVVGWIGIAMGRSLSPLETAGLAFAALALLLLVFGPWD